MTVDRHRVPVGELVAKIAGMIVVFSLALFLPAGTLLWTAGWVFLVLFFTFVIALSAWLLRANPALLAERLSGVGHAEQKTWDKVLLAVVAVAFFAWLVLMPLDAVRFRWSHVPMWLQAIGALLLVASFPIFFLTFRENSFLSPAVRVQTERAQTVVSTGPYAVVRHPMYAGFVVFAFATALLLGSWYGVAGAILLVVLVARRAVLEERVLTHELDGYDAYKTRVRYRFLPRIW